MIAVLLFLVACLVGLLGIDIIVGGVVARHMKHRGQRRSAASEMRRARRQSADVDAHQIDADVRALMDAGGYDPADVDRWRTCKAMVEDLRGMR